MKSMTHISDTVYTCSDDGDFEDVFPSSSVALPPPDKLITVITSHSEKYAHILGARIPPKTTKEIPSHLRFICEFVCEVEKKIM